MIEVLAGKTPVILNTEIKDGNIQIVEVGFYKNVKITQMPVSVDQK